MNEVLYRPFSVIFEEAAGKLSASMLQNINKRYRDGYKFLRKGIIFARHALLCIRILQQI